MKLPIACASFLVAAVSLLTTDLHATSQEPPALEFPQASPLATVRQRVGLTDVEIVYSRPSAKGRKVFGDLVPYDQLWRTGANAATKITFSTDVVVGGEPLAAGAYSLFTNPGTPVWTVIFNKVPDQSGTSTYDETQDALRLTVSPVALPSAVETFRIAVDELRADGATLTLAWEKTQVSVDLKVDVVGAMLPKIQAAMAAEGKKPYFQAAWFYYENGLDLKQAALWMEEANKERPDTVWMVHRHALVLAKAGDKAGALAKAKASLALAEKAGGALGAEYKRLNEQLIASLK